MTSRSQGVISTAVLQRLHLFLWTCQLYNNSSDSYKITIQASNLCSHFRRPWQLSSNQRSSSSIDGSTKVFWNTALTIRWRRKRRKRNEITKDVFSKNLSVHQSNIDRFYNRNFQGKKGLFVIQETASPSKNQAEAKPDANKISGAVSAAGGMFYKIIQIRTYCLLLGR